MGAISPAAAAQQAAALSAAFKAAGVQTTDLESFAQAGQIITSTPGYQYTPGQGECSGQPAPDLNLFVKGGSMALGVAGGVTGILASPAIGIISSTAGLAIGAATLGIGTIIGIYSIFHAHHAAAVAKEQSVLCAAVPAANNYLKVIAQAVQSGAATPQQAIAALNSLLTDFRSAVSGILKMSGSQCNAACYLIIALTAVVNYQVSAYQDLANAKAAPSAPVTSPAPAAGSGPAPAPVVASGSTMLLPPATNSSGAPVGQAAAAPSTTNWLGIAALLFGGFLVARAL